MQKKKEIPKMIIIGLGQNTSTAFEQDCINIGMNDFCKLPLTEKSIL